MSPIYLLDHYAYTGKSFFHQRNALAKITFLGLVLLSVVLTHSLLKLTSLFLLVASLIVSAQLPLVQFFRWSLYPAFLASLFALSQINFGYLPILTILKAINAGLLMLFIFSTTPFPHLFNLIYRTSSVSANLFLFTYRFFFLWLDKFQIKLKLFRIRGGYQKGILFSLKNLSFLIASLFCQTYQQTEKFSLILNRRGYQGKFFLKKENFHLGDLSLILLGLSIFAFGIWL